MLLGLGRRRGAPFCARRHAPGRVIAITAALHGACPVRSQIAAARLTAITVCNCRICDECGCDAEAGRFPRKGASTRVERAVPVSIIVAKGRNSGGAATRLSCGRFIKLYARSTLRSKLAAARGPSVLLARALEFHARTKPMSATPGNDMDVFGAKTYVAAVH